MERKLKLAAALSLVVLTTAACAPNPYWQYPGSSAGYNNYNRSNTAVNRNAVTHTHCGKTHTHVLPPQGLAHHHGDGCMAGSGGGSTTTYNNGGGYSGGYNNSYNTGGNYYNPQPNTGTGSTTYGYGSGGNYGSGSTGSGNYSSGGSNYGSGTSGYSSGGSSSYYDYVAPKGNSTTGNSGSSSSSYNYSSGSGSSSSGSSSNSYAGGDSYVVQKGDTVFQVMRNTGVYWKDIIRLNNLQAPDYNLVPGQRLRLK